MPRLIYYPDGPSIRALNRGAIYLTKPATKRGFYEISLPAAPVLEVRQRDLVRARRETARALKRAAPDVHHEIAMLAACYQSRRLRPSYTAWFIHLRTTLNFFAGKGHVDDEVYAQDYFSDPLHWHRRRRAFRRPRELTRLRKAADELAAHLTYSRARWRKRRPAPPSARLTGYIKDLYAEFLRLLDSDARNWFTGPRRPKMSNPH